MSMAGKESFGGTEKSVPLLKSSSSNENHGKNKVDESLALTIRSEKDATLVVDKGTQLKRKTDVLQSLEDDAAFIDECNSSESKKQCPELEGRIQNIQMQVSNPNGDKLQFQGVDCTKVNLVDEKLLMMAKRETMELRTANVKLSDELKILKNMLAMQNEEIKGLKAQSEVYKKDLLSERAERQKVAAQIATDLQSLLKLNQMLIGGVTDDVDDTVTEAETQSLSIKVSDETANTTQSTRVSIRKAKTAVLPTAEPIKLDPKQTNAVDRLFRIQKFLKWPAPTYTLIDYRQLANGAREFIIEIECNGKKARGIAIHKRKARRMAAENILIKMGYAKDGSLADDDILIRTAYDATSDSK